MTPLHQLRAEIREAEQARVEREEWHVTMHGEYAAVRYPSGLALAIDVFPTDARYIARTNPANITRILDALDKAEAALAKCTAQAGTPDAAEGCRLIIRTATDALKELRQG